MRIAATILALAIAAPAAAQEAAPSALADVYACADLAEAEARLACYDAAVQRLRAAESTGDLLAVDRTQAETVQREAFGFSLPTLPRIFRRGEGGVEELQTMSFELARLSRRADGKASFVMTNGQVWTQIEQERVTAREGARVTIERASLGSFLLSVEGGARGVRVRRSE